MAFFHKVKDTFSQAGQSTVKMAKEFSETTKLNNEISEAETQINNLYLEIGYQIYVAHSADPLPEVAELIEKINALHDKIDDNRAQIQAINAAGHCPNCGAKIKPGMAFCSSCGTKLAVEQPQPEPKPAKPMFCANCGAQVSPDASFCTSCGAPIP